MADSDKITTRYNYAWIHSVFGHFVEDTMDYFASYLYPRFSSWKIIGTYDKAVEYINKQKQLNREADQPLRPGLILDPSGDFAFDETYGKMMYRYPNLAPGLVKYLFEPIYQDKNIIITAGFSRIVGEFNFTALLSSFYEYCDMKVYLNLIFGGLERYIYPRWFNSFIIIPDEINDYIYTNDVTGETYKLNLEGTTNSLIKTTNSNEVVYPCTILPRYKLSSVSDVSSRLGGTDGLPDWKLGFTISYEIELPTFLVLESDFLTDKMNINIRYGSCYSANNSYDNSEEVPAYEESFDINTNLGLDSTSNSTVIYPDEATIDNKKSKLEKTRYFHIVTKEEEESTTTIDLNIPEVILNKDLLKLSGKYGFLLYGDHYIIVDDGTVIRIDKENVELTENDILEIFIYEYV